MRIGLDVTALVKEKFPWRCITKRRRYLVPQKVRWKACVVSDYSRKLRGVSLQLPIVVKMVRLTERLVLHCMRLRKFPARFTSRYGPGTSPLPLLLTELVRSLLDFHN